MFPAETCPAELGTRAPSSRPAPLGAARQQASSPNVTLVQQHRRCGELGAYGNAWPKIHAAGILRSLEGVAPERLRHTPQSSSAAGDRRGTPAGPPGGLRPRAQHAGSAGTASGRSAQGTQFSCSPARPGMSVEVGGMGRWGRVIPLPHPQYLRLLTATFSLSGARGIGDCSHIGVDHSSPLCPAVNPSTDPKSETDS